MERSILFAVIALLPPAVLAGLPNSVRQLSETAIVPGVTWYQVTYMAIIYIMIVALVGRHFFARMLPLLAALVFPMFFVTPLVIYIIKLGGIAGDIQGYGPHYLNLVISMLTFIPLATAFVDLVRKPIMSYEGRMILNAQGISLARKGALLACRVVMHLLYFVLPSLLEVIREERILERVARSSKTKIVELKASGQLLLRIVYYVTCDAIQLIPFWVTEIVALPKKAGSWGASDGV